MNTLENFQEMKKLLQEKSAWQLSRRNIYDGKYTANTLNIALPAAFDRKLKTHLAWPKIAIDTLRDSLSFDAFENDTLGFTSLLNTFGGYESIDSAIKNSMIGACAFISVLPDSETGKPFFNVYSGAEASGLYDSATGLLSTGIVINSYSVVGQQKLIKDYLLFEPGMVYKISANGEILEKTKVLTDRLLLIPFIYDQDVAVNPFGSSRISAPAINALESALRTLKLLEFGNDSRVALRNILMAEGTSPEEIGTITPEPSLNTITTLFSEGTGTLKLAQVVAPPTEELQKMLGLLAGNFASSMSMPASAFGYHPVNGVAGGDSIEDTNRALNNLIQRQRSVYGNAIKMLAITAMSLSTGQYFDEWNQIDAAFSETVNTNKIGALADGLGKLSLIAPGYDFSKFIDKHITGKSLKSQALSVSLPSFEKSKNAAASFSKLKPDNNLGV